MYAPAGKSGSSWEQKAPERIHAVGEKEHFHLDFVKQWPDADLNCVKDYGKGPQRLSPEDVNAWTSGKNSEWKRRLDFATSFTAASMRVLEKIAKEVPAELSGMIAPGQGGVMEALVLLKSFAF